jgi:hypothetical protein
MESTQVGVLLAWSQLSSQVLVMGNFLKASDFDEDSNLKKDVFSDYCEAIILCGYNCII